MELANKPTLSSDDKFHCYLRCKIEEADSSFIHFQNILVERIAELISEDEGTATWKFAIDGHEEKRPYNKYEVGDLAIVLPNGGLLDGFITKANFEDIEREMFGFFNEIVDQNDGFNFYCDNYGNPPDPEGYAALTEMAELKTGGHESSGAFVYGESFAGKTTATVHFLVRWATYYAAQMICQNHQQRPYNGPIKSPRKSVLWLEADEFAEQAKNKAKFGQTAEWLEALISVPILVIDDLDKFQLSESVEVAFFAVLKRRIESDYSDKFTIITSNQEPERFVNRFSFDRRIPILNRFRKYYTPFKFQIENEKA